MNIQFGDFEEVEPDDRKDFIEETSKKIKVSLTKTFNVVKTPQYSDVFIAYPHQSYSNEYHNKNPNSKTLEIYIFSLPDDMDADLYRSEGLTFNESPLSLYSGQRDLLNVKGSLPKGYTAINDANDRPIAYTKDNRIWILYDIYHNIGVDSGVEKVAEQILRYIIDNHISPPSKEELRQRIVELLEKSMSENISNTKRSVNEQVKRLETDVQSTEQRLTELVIQLNQQQQLKEALELAKKPDIYKELERLEKIPYVEQVQFRGNNLKILTHEINVGPYEFGKWTITLNAGIPSFKHEQSGKTRHPYEYENGSFCMGGFANAYNQAIAKAEFCKALNFCRLEITNYDTGTRQVEIERFLSKQMGKKYDKILEEVRKEHFKISNDIVISNINLSTVKYIGRQKNSDEIIGTTESKEITY